MTRVLGGMIGPPGAGTNKALVGSCYGKVCAMIHLHVPQEEVSVTTLFGSNLFYTKVEPYRRYDSFRHVIKLLMHI